MTLQLAVLKQINGEVLISSGGGKKSEKLVNITSLVLSTQENLNLFHSFLFYLTLFCIIIRMRGGGYALTRVYSYFFGVHFVVIRTLYHTFSKLLVH